ncbi:MAG: class I SAM-dependent methyltransferase, partial [Candidatus Dormibacteraceae bacterium]
IEVNPAMATRARQAGVTIIASDILAPRLSTHFADRFDAILALSVFEHTSDIRRACQAAVEMLKPSGVLIFEVPLIGSSEGSDEEWFRSSLEHIFYPESASIQYLFDDVLGVYLSGRGVMVREYAPVYMGVVTKTRSRSDEVRSLLGQVFDTPLHALGPGTLRSARVFFDLVHAGQRTAASILALREMWADATEPLWMRVIDLWLTTERDVEALKVQLADVTDYLSRVEAARDWHREQACAWEAIAGDREDSSVGQQDEIG